MAAVILLGVTIVVMIFIVSIVKGQAGVFDMTELTSGDIIKITFAILFAKLIFTILVGIFAIILSTLLGLSLTSFLNGII